MGTAIPGTLKSRKTRETLLDAALKQFRSQGFEKTTMRDIAKNAGLSLGAFYYSFKTKDEIVVAFYAQTGAEALQKNEEIVADSRDFTKRFQNLLTFNLSQLMPYRNLIAVLVRQGIDLSNPLSPFSTSNQAIRNQAIGMIEDCISGSNLKVSRPLRPYLARILWLYQLGIVFYWTNDVSKNQKNTKRLISLSLHLVVRLLKLSTLPMLRSVNRTVIEIVELIQQPGNV